MKYPVVCMAALLLLWATACRKENVATPSSPDSFTEFVIPKGGHNVKSNAYKAVDLSEMKFRVRFDSSCIYQTKKPENQNDINKLYGFSDNDALHHEFSARIGWRWSNGALRLFAYTYNNGVREEKEITIVNIGEEIECSIKIAAGSYLFLVDKAAISLPRQSTTAKAKGYLLYPYFGGDEVAPHDIRIWIKNLAPGLSAAQL